MEILRVPMDEVDRDYMQFLHFERESYKDVLSYILLEKQKGYEFSKENYEHFMSEYREANLKFGIAFNNMLEIYAPQYIGNNDYTAQFDFSNCAMVIVENANNSCSSCSQCGK